MIRGRFRPEWLKVAAGRHVGFVLCYLSMVSERIGHAFGRGRVAGNGAASSRPDVARFPGTKTLHKTAGKYALNISKTFLNRFLSQSPR